MYSSSAPPSFDAYLKYYQNQAGRGYAHPNISTFRGRTYQHGNGLGSIFAGLLRTLTPLFSSPAVKSVASNIGKRLLTTGMNIGSDVLAGQNLASSLRQRAKETGASLMDDAAATLRQSGSGIKRLRRRRKRVATSNKKRRGRKPSKRQSKKRPVRRKRRVASKKAIKKRRRARQKTSDIFG